MHLDIGVFLLHPLGETLVAQLWLIGADQAERLKRDPFLADQLGEFVGSHCAAGFVVKVDETQELPFWWRILYDEDGDVGFVGPLYSGDDKFGIDGVNQQRVGLFGHRVEDLGQLKLRVTFAAEDLHNETSFGGLILDPVEQSGLVLELKAVSVIEIDAEGKIWDCLTAGVGSGASGPDGNTECSAEYYYA